MLEYYDTIYFDEAFMNIVLTHVLKDEIKIAEVFLNDNREKILFDETFNKAKNILKDGKEGLNMKKYYKFTQ